MENNQVPNETNNTVQPVVPTNEAQVQPVTAVPVVATTAGVVEEPKPVVPQTTTTSAPSTGPAKNAEAFNSKEKVLFEIEPEKESNPMGTLIIFAVLGIGLLFLPLADKLINRGTGPSGNNNLLNTGQEIINNTGLTNVYYFEKEQSSIGIDNLELKNFVTQETETGYKINFTIINNGEAAYQYDKKYYMDFYEGEKLIYHALIHSYRPIASKGADNLSLEISEKAFARADSLKLVETKVELYPKYEFDTKEGDYDTLTCTYDKTEIVYYFKDNMLEQIRETYTNNEYEKENFSKLKSTKQTEINAYRKVEGMNANFVETEQDFTAQVDFMLADVVDSSLQNLRVYRFFKYHEKANIVAYEMPAMGYMCS